MHPVQALTKYHLSRARKTLLGRPIFEKLPKPRLETDPRELSCRPGLFVEEQLDRVTGCNRGRSLSSMMKVWTEKRWVESPLEIYELGPASIVGGVVATPSALHWFSPHQPRIADSLGVAPKTKETVVASSQQEMKFFGHWLGDDCAAYEAYRDHPHIRSMHRPKWADLPFFESAFAQDWKEHAVLQSDNLILLRSLGFDRRKAARYRILRERLRNAAAGDRRPNNIVFIRRGLTAKPRAIIRNEAELVRRLEEHGIEIATPEENTAAFMQKILDASLIISVEGSQACHAIYALRDGG